MSLQDLIEQSPCKNIIEFDSDSSDDSGRDYSENSTPVKRQTNTVESLRIETDDIEQQKLSYTPNVGLLTFSNSNLLNLANEAQLLHSAFQLVRTKASLFQQTSTPKTDTQIRKPRVNFHSIDDIVNGGKTSSDENEDSGIQTSSNSASNASNFDTTPQHEYVDDESNKENDSKKSNSNNKKIRTTFSDQQKWMLEQYFRQNPYPDPRETEDLSKQLVLPENVIKVWFQNKRSRDKQRKFTKQSVSTSTPSKNTETPSALQHNNNLQYFGHLAALKASQFLNMF